MAITSVSSHLGTTANFIPLPPALAIIGRGRMEWGRSGDHDRGFCGELGESGPGDSIG